MPEISEEDFLRFNALQTRVTNILAHPQAARLVEQANKIVDPNARTPRLDADAVQNEAIQSVNTKIDKFISEQQERDAAQQRQAALDRLNEQHARGMAVVRGQYTEEGVKAIEKIMVDKGLTDPLDAAAIFDRDNPAPTPAAPSGMGAWNFMEQAPGDDQVDISKLIETRGASEQLADKMAYDTLNSIRSQNARR